MRSWQLNKDASSPADLVLVEREKSQPGLGEVLIRIRACSINYRDSLIPKGQYMGGVIERVITPLADGAGEVEAIRITGGVDHIVEVGGQGTLAQSMQAIGFNGDIAIIGVLSREGNVKPRDMMFKAGRMRGIFVGSAAMARSLNKAIDANGIKPVVDKVFGFEGAKSAYAHHASSALFGKTVISI